MDRFWKCCLLWAGMTFACESLVLSPILADDENASAKSPPQENVTLAPDAGETAARLDRILPANSEARDMYRDILKGSRLGPQDGWFRKGVSQTRFTWSVTGRRYDSNADGEIQPQEFSGSVADFARLDRNRDQRLTAVDFDWSEHALNRTPGAMLFYQADADGNGKVTRAEFAQMFDELGNGEGDFLSLDDLRDRLAMPTRGNREAPRDQPSVATLLKGLEQQEIGSLQPGPAVDDRAPDFTLKSVDGRLAVTLSEHIGPKPVVLVFGNFTCGPFRSQAGNVEKFYQRYRDRTTFLMVYVREAHPADGWWMESNNRVGIEIPQPTSYDERAAVATRCAKHLALSFPVLVDELDDRVGTQYSGMPSRLYVIDKKGRIAYKSGRGPFGFKSTECEQSLVLLLNQAVPTDVSVTGNRPPSSH